VSALARLWAPDLPWNARRFAGDHGHVESWFLRANHPSRPLAIWLKVTILAPLEGPPVAESWVIWFDGEAQRTQARRFTEPLAAASLEGARLSTSRVALQLGAQVGVEGRFEAGADGPAIAVSLACSTLGATPSGPLTPYPGALVRAALPRNKLVTPFPSLRAHGRLELGAQSIVVDGWLAMQGHNWGPAHPFDYAWGHCEFPGEQTVVEGFTGRIQVAGRTSPQLSALVVHRAGRTWRFDRLFDTWRQRASYDGTRWSVSLLGPDGEATLQLNAEGRPQVCLGYDNPDGQRSYCVNTKLAHATLTVRPADGASFTCVSEHGGALEFLSRAADPRFPHVV
jgi:hypothetical protein